MQYVINSREVFRLLSLAFPQKKGILLDCCLCCKNNSRSSFMLILPQLLVQGELVKYRQNEDLSTSLNVLWTILTKKNQNNTTLRERMR